MTVLPNTEVEAESNTSTGTRVGTGADAAFNQLLSRNVDNPAIN
jgi:hypothetical protein